MRRARKVQSYDEVTVYQLRANATCAGAFLWISADRCQLPNGVIVEKCSEGDSFWGSQEVLIEAGFAKPEWFPTTFPPGKNKGTCKADFILQDEGRSIHLYRAKKSARPRANRWHLSVEVSATEKARRAAEKEAIERRQAEEERRHQQDEERREEGDQEERLRVLIENLPPFVPGSMSELEKYLMRIVRGLSARGKLHLCEMAKNLLVFDHGEDSPPEEPQPPSRPRLTLAVDNTCR